MVRVASSVMPGSLCLLQARTGKKGQPVNISHKLRFSMTEHLQTCTMHTHVRSWEELFLEVLDAHASALDAIQNQVPDPTAVLQHDP